MMKTDNSREARTVEAEKEVAYYSAVVEAWVSTRMERDRTLLTLSTAGVGLLATLLTTVGASSSLERWLYAAAGTGFVIAIVAALMIFERNGDHLLDVIQSNRRTDDPRLQRLDKILFWAFLAGVFLTGAVAISSASNASRDVSNTNPASKGDTMEKKSLTGIGNLAPSPQPTQGGAQKPATSTGATKGTAKK